MGRQRAKNRSVGNGFALTFISSRFASLPPFAINASFFGRWHPLSQGSAVRAMRKGLLCVVSEIKSIRLDFVEIVMLV
jgi:hypothetical protein